MEYAIGIDLGGTSIKYALIDTNGEFIFSGKIPSFADQSETAVISQILVAIQDILDYTKEHQLTVKGIGIGTPGIVDATNRIILGAAENIKGWENIFLADIIEEKIGLPVLISNDANLMGLGETHYGAGRGASHVVFLTVGTGIGGAVVIDHTLFNGYDNRGTELGHIPLIANGEKCACGAIGCLEHYASTAALLRSFIRCCEEEGVELIGEIDGEKIVRLYKEGDEIARRCFEEHCTYLGQGIAGLINIFSPQKVIIGGGLSEAGEFYIKKLSEETFKYAMRDCAVNTKIMAAELGNRAGSMGAAWFVFSTCY